MHMAEAVSATVRVMQTVSSRPTETSYRENPSTCSRPKRRIKFQHKCTQHSHG